MVECKVKCEFSNGCRVESLDEQRVDLVHEKTRIAIEVYKGPNDLEFVNPRIVQMDELQKQIDEIAKQIGAQVLCQKCPWR